MKPDFVAEAKKRIEAGKTKGLPVFETSIESIQVDATEDNYTDEEPK